jgi:DNA-directed RNA polymerase subunit M/transcription elongation factor TFIIS
MSIDVQQQWRELEETYSQMADEELESLASQAYELTDIARQVLQRQITSRNLKFSLSLRPPPDESPGDGPRGDLDPAELPLVHCSEVWSADEARIVMNTLYKAGIPAYLGPDLVEKVEDFPANFEKGIEVFVRDVDQQRAHAALRDINRPADDRTDDEPEASLPRCPKCGSEEIVFLELERAADHAADDPKFHWHCDACGDDWQDDGVTEN